MAMYSATLLFCLVSMSKAGPQLMGRQAGDQIKADNKCLNPDHTARATVSVF